jgi:hypothetical protein
MVVGTRAVRPDRANDEQPDPRASASATTTDVAPAPDPDRSDPSGPDADPALDDHTDQARDAASTVPPASRWRRVGAELARDRSAALAFGALVVASFFLIVFWFGRNRWFYGDEWTFLAGPQASTLGDWFAPHNDHWTTLPRLVYRVLWYAVGLRAYWPYLACLAALHLAVVTLLRVVMRRAGVGGWMATLVAGSFLLFGAGQENLQWAFQITFVGALVGGLAHLVLADHDGALDRRDVLGLVCGLLGLLCSGVAPAMVVIVGAAVLVRRGWRAAAVHTVPLALVYGSWLVLEQVRTTSGGTPTVGVVTGWVRASVVASFVGLGQNAVTAALLGVLRVVGLTLAWSPLGFAEFRRRAAAPVALMAGAMLFFVSVAVERWAIGEQVAESSRYVYTGAALVLPALAVAAQAVVSRWRLATPLVVLLILSGVPGNVADMNTSEATFDTARAMTMAVPASPLARQVPHGPPRSRHDRGPGRHRGLARRPPCRQADRTPADARPSPRRCRSVSVSTRPRAEPPTECRTYVAPLDVEPGTGALRHLHVGQHRPDQRQDAHVPTHRLPAPGRHDARGRAPDLHLRFEPVAPATTFLLCT